MNKRKGDKYLSEKFKRYVAQTIQETWLYDDITLREEMREQAVPRYQAIINVNNKRENPIIKGKIVFFWGYGGTYPTVFIEVVKGWVQNKDITHLIDIRDRPRSGMYFYNKASLEKIGIKSETDIIYVHIQELGNPGYNLEEYLKYVKSAQFARGLRKLFDILRLETTKNVVLFCAEKYYNECHRQIVARVLRSRPFFLDVLHLSPRYRPKRKRK